MIVLESDILILKLIYVTVCIFTESIDGCHWWCGDDVIDCSQYNPNEIVRIGDTEDCTKYYQCYEFELSHNDCPEPWFFDC